MFEGCCVCIRNGDGDSGARFRTGTEPKEEKTSKNKKDGTGSRLEPPVPSFDLQRMRTALE
ncbi:MAG: hypothetical protein DMG41_14235 [Acidobacteria bacterium]|nr:MAG: hypothetical protein DMG42_30285 [Acidobacteriota bacterium]PYT87687.1 MAG: hypothetical protein DMG41_14235 [Acidobacteriota bacterium]